MFSSWDELHDEMYRVELAFTKILGLRPLYLRPPYGNVNDFVLSAIDNRGYKSQCDHVQVAPVPPQSLTTLSMFLRTL